MSKQALLNINLLAARKGAAELEFAVKKVHSLDSSKGTPDGYIKAIEKCDIRSLENKSFIAGYVRTYAKYLGLDPDYVYDRFCKESGFISSDLNSFRPAKKRKKEKISSIPINSNFLSLSKFSDNKFKISLTSNFIIKKLCLCARYF